MILSKCTSFDFTKLYHYKIYDEYILKYDDVYSMEFSQKADVKLFRFNAHDMKTFAFVKQVVLFFSMIEVGILKDEIFTVTFSSIEEEAKATLMGLSR